MDILKDNISNLKDKVLLAINQIGLYSELKYAKDILLKELSEKEINIYNSWLNTYEIKLDEINKDIIDNINKEINNDLSEQDKLIEKIEKIIEYSLINYPDLGRKLSNSYKELLKKYYAWLEVFYENKVELISKSIKDNINTSIFDNSNDTQVERIETLKKEIEETVNYISDNYPQFGESIRNSFEELKKYYENAYEDVLDTSKKGYDMELGIMKDPVYKIYFERMVALPKEPIISLYQDSYTVRNCYINRLESFSESCGNINVFAEKDTKIKETIKKAYEEIADDSVVKMINEIEKNYLDVINLCIKSDFSLIGIERVQDNTLEHCNKLQEIIDKEVTKKNYYNEINNMTLNIPTDKLMDIINYVETNNIFKEELYDRLYVLVEKEKYLKHVYYGEPELYPQLSEKHKVILRKKYIDSLTDYSEEETTEIIDKLMKQGYMSLMDNRYRDFFDSCSYNNRPTPIGEEEKYRIFSNLSYMGLASKVVVLVYDGEGMQVPCSLSDFNKKIMKKIAFTVPEPLNVKVKEELSLKYIWIKAGNKYYFVDKITGEVINLPKEFAVLKPIQIFDFYKINSSEDGLIITGSYDIFNDKFEIIKHLDNVDKFHTDSVKRNVAVSYKKQYYVEIYDSKFNYIKTIYLSEILEDSHLVSINDGIMAICNENCVVYYDYINMKVVIKNNGRTYVNFDYGYGEGLFVFNKGKLCGYKDINGNEVIPPIYKYAAPFMNNIGMVTSSECYMGFVDRVGNFYSGYSWFNEIHKNKEKYFETHELPTKKNKHEFGRHSFLTDPGSAQYVKLDHEAGKYYFARNSAGLQKMYFSAINHYTVNNETPIKDIDLDIKKGKTFKKTIN